MSELAVMTEEKCLSLLQGSEVGRVALCMPEGPQIFPVNFTVVDDAVIFRTTPYSVLGTHAWQTRLAMEVDHIDYERSAGWSVVISGPGTRVDAGPVLDDIVHRWNPQPWAAGTRPLYVRLRWDRISGRRIGDWTEDNELPLQRGS
jgi:nitroimidazol reductase NimA-like FMN-containing flavoprotein (pyridoxamine 5'-phosphate oxidase superfamily)